MKLLALIAAIFISGCSTPLISKNGGLSDPLKNYPGQDTGYIFGFIGATTSESTLGNTLSSKIIISYKEDPSPKATIMLQGRPSEPLDYESDMVDGRVFLVEVPVGQYSINRVGFHGTDGTRSITTGSRYAIEYDFDIKAGEVSYIGSFIAESYTMDTMFGLASTGQGYFGHSFNETRDTKLGITKYPNINFGADNFNSTKEIILHPPLILNKSGEY